MNGSPSPKADPGRRSLLLPLARLLEPWIRPALEGIVVRCLESRVPPLKPLDARLKRLEAGIRQQRQLMRELGSILAWPFISPDTTVARALSLHESAGRLLAEHNLDSCHACPVSRDETIRELALAHGIDLDDLLKKLNTPLKEARP